MKIVETNLKFKSLSALGKVKQIVLHHAVTPTNYGAADMHRIHLNKGWSGCGYHFVIKGDGTIERGRPENCLGAHVANMNTGRIGVCFAGDFEKNKMAKAQIEAGKELVAYLKNKYKVGVVKHKDLMATSCPGKLFPFDEIVNGKVEVKPEAPSKPTQQKKKLWEVSIEGEEVKSLQRLLGVKVDGYFGDNTLKACPLLKKGSNGPIVKLMQQRLLNRGYKLPKYGADGGFGDETVTAVKRCQDCFSLSQDGIVGQNTWKALYGLDKGRF